MVNQLRFGRLWLILSLVMFCSFSVLLYFGREIYLQAPPIPETIVSTSGEVLYSGEDIRDGQNVWQSLGGQEMGTVWGHGAYVAPDWSADWLHRESSELLNVWARNKGFQSFEELPANDQIIAKEQLKKELRQNTYNPSLSQITISGDRAKAIHEVERHYHGLFGADSSLNSLRESYAIPPNAIKDPKRFHQLDAFFFWAAWSTVTTRPGSLISYTQNWPHDERVGNTPPASLTMWSVASVLFLLIAVAWMTWKFAASTNEVETFKAPDQNPIADLKLTPSMKATLKYFWVVAALLLSQIGLGIITAHYGVEGQSLYGFPIAQWIPYVLTRTWHTQAGIFWIATAWLATGLFLVPVISGHEPRWQKQGVDFLFYCLLVIVAGSFFGQWLGVQQKLGFQMNFWFGHQGYTYVDLGRFWQIFLLIGLFVWLGLMARGILPVLFRSKKNESNEPEKNIGNRQLLWMFLLSATAIGSFYAPGLMWGQRTHLSIAEYWRWWVVHLWVEGFFEVFATVAIAFLFTRMGLLSTVKAARATLSSAAIFLLGGILGTFHHLYFSGTPTSVLALGASFSALEVVPLVLVGHEAWENLKMSRAKPWVAKYRWPIYFFLAVSFWNFVGAGVFGFMINTPIALYFMQGLNTTPVHGHTALFGVYGMLGIGFMLFCLNHLTQLSESSDKLLKVGFWSLNIGLMVMVLFSLLPIGLLQTHASITQGMWFARSAEFMQTPHLRFLKWLRVPGDVIFAVGVLATTLTVFTAKRRNSSKSSDEVESTQVQLAFEEVTS